jgi:peptide alpha-N-acetyltransferase
MPEPTAVESNIGGGGNVTAKNKTNDDATIIFVDYVDERLIDDVMKLVSLDLSEPYSIFTYRYFLHRFPDLCILAVDSNTKEVCGCVVGKIDIENIHNNQQQHHHHHESDAAVPPETVVPESNNHELSINNSIQTGYIGMLAVRDSHRRKGIGKSLVRQVLKRMKDRGCSSATLETEVSNVTAQKLYQNFGFIREELLVRYYLNNGDAYRLRLWF